LKATTIKVVRFGIQITLAAVIFSICVYGTAFLLGPKDLILTVLPFLSATILGGFAAGIAYYRSGKELLLYLAGMELVYLLAALWLHFSQNTNWVSPR